MNKLKILHLQGKITWRNLRLNACAKQLTPTLVSNLHGSPFLNIYEPVDFVNEFEKSEAWKASNASQTSHIRA